jgi:hypothetical protein
MIYAFYSHARFFRMGQRERRMLERNKLKILHQQENSPYSFYKNYLRATFFSLALFYDFAKWYAR